MSKYSDYSKMYENIFQLFRKFVSYFIQKRPFLTVKISSPHASCDTSAVPDVAAFGQGLIQRHAQKVDSIVESADEKIHLSMSFCFQLGIIYINIIFHIYIFSIFKCVCNL